MPSTLFPQPSEQDESGHVTEPDTFLAESRRRLYKNGRHQATGRNSSQSWVRFGHCAWLLEILSCVTSIVCLIGIGILLKNYNQQPVPALPLGITLNTLLAFLTTLCKAAFAYPVFQALSQLKWNWFTRKKRPLIHLEAFDRASRGAAGSIRLLVATKGRISSIIAAIILVSSTVTSTITQAVITSSTRYAPGDGIATIGRLLNYTRDFSQDGAIEILPAFMQAVFTPANQPYAYIGSTCSTGNCRWSPFNSLAVCVTMNDVTDKLDMTGGEGPNATLPNGFALHWLINITADPIFPDHRVPFASQTLSFAGQTDLLLTGLLDTSIIYANATTFGAVEILFHFCVESYEIQTVNGSTSTNRTASYTDIAYSYGSDNTTTVLTSPGDHQNYTISSDSSDFFITPAFGLFSGVYNFDQETMDQGATPLSMALGLALYTPGVLNPTIHEGEEQTRQTILNIMQNIAISMTNVLRYYSGSNQTGTALVIENFIIIRWGYLVFLAVQVLLSAILLFWVIIQSARLQTEVVKDSVLATLFAINSEDKALLEEVEGKVGPTFNNNNNNNNNNTTNSHIDSMTKMAKRSTGKLVQGEKGWRFRIDRASLMGIWRS